MVVLGDDEARPRLLEGGVGDPAQAQEDGPALERKIGVRVRDLDHPRLGARRGVDEPAAEGARTDVGDDVQFLVGVGEGALDAGVERGRDDQLVRQVTLAQHSGEAGEQPVNRAGLVARAEDGVELLVQRPESLHRRDVLRDPAERAGQVGGNAEGVREALRQLGAPDEPDDGHDPSRQHGTEDLGLHLSRGPAVPGRHQPCLLAQDLCVQLLELGAGLDPELLDEYSPRLPECLQGLCLPAAAVQREHAQRAHPLTQRRCCSEHLELADDVTVKATLDVGVDALLERIEPQLLEPPDLTLRELLARQIGERRAAPERQRRPQQLRSLAGRERARLDEHGLEAKGVDGVPARRRGRSPARASRGRRSPGTRRSCATAFCNEVVAVFGALSPQTRSTRRSVETTCP